MKEDIKNFWNRKPCGTGGVIPENVSLEYFEQIRKRRYKLEPFIWGIVEFPSLKNKKVLEIGCGVGIDGLEFVKAGADYIGTDFSKKSVELAKKYFELSSCDSNRVIFVDAEDLPFRENTFDFIYSWGAIHHTPDINKAVSEIRRVLKPSGNFCIMLYNRYSFVGLQLYILYGLLRLKLFISWKKLFAEYHESPGTKAFTDREAVDLFNNFKNVSIINLITPYDLRITRNFHLPLWVGKILPRQSGFFKVIQGNK